MKRLLTGVVGLALNCYVAAAPMLRIEPLNLSVDSGSSFSVDLQISGLTENAAPSLGAYDITIFFDPSILSFTGVTLGNQLNIFGLGDISTITSSNGAINLFELSLESAAALNSLQLDSFRLAKLSFNAVGVGTSLVDLSVNALSDADGLPLTVAVAGGSVSSTAPVPELSTLQHLLAGLVALTIGSRFYRQSRILRIKTRFNGRHIVDTYTALTKSARQERQFFRHD